MTQDSVSLDALTQNIEKWAQDCNLFDEGNKLTQGLKLVEEFGELAAALLRGKNIEDHAGDMFVVLVILTRLAGTTMSKSVAVAYDEIKDRRGVMLDGVFIKSTDAAYPTALATIAARQT
jgi:NTP pyrophosphatase (non-canonical NTP hydrolase)